ncbi:MAG TPA: VWA domain-containing protein [Geopsychrobacteraceae bacterium]|nr:VWA domain-containing protein [Geopsychrobacteraceae bacterium]
MSSFHFLRPEWFLVLPPLLLALFWYARRQLRSQSWQAVCDPELLPHLLLGRSVRRANWPLWLLLAGLLLAVLALAGPVWERKPQPVFRQQSALVILFDLSRSMQAADLKPSRFLRARLKIEDLLRQREEGQTALIVFAADAFTVTPLTDDRHTIESLLKSLEPEMMPAQGSDPARAIELGQGLLQQAGLTSGRLLLVTDEDQPSSALDAASKLQQQGYELAVLGVGTLDGAPIPRAGGGFFKDAQGDPVFPKLNRAGLQELATAGGGSYSELSIDDSDLNTLLAGLDDRRLNQAVQEDENSAATGDRWREEGIWLLWPLTLLAAFAFRRGWLLVLPLLLLVPAPAEAFTWTDLWQTSDQQAAQAFEQQDYAEAAEQFQDDRWKASALYKAGEFDAAAKQWENPQDAEDWYNLGNAQARKGDLPAAQNSYQQALELEPEHVDAQFNKGLVEEAMQEQKKEQEQQQQDDMNQPKKEEQRSGGEDNPSQQPKSSSESQEKPDGEKAQPDQSQGPETEQDAEPAAQPSPAEDEKEQAPEPEELSQSKAGQDSSDQQQEKTSAAEELAEESPESSEQRESRLLLQQIPDDPGGLLRRKFLYQYRQRGQQSESDRSW